MGVMVSKNAVELGLSSAQPQHAGVELKYHRHAAGEQRLRTVKHVTFVPLYIHPCEADLLRVEQASLHEVVERLLLDDDLVEAFGVHLPAVDRMRAGVPGIEQQLRGADLIGECDR